MADISELAARAAQFPCQPGVYIMRDAEGRVIYVGKAVNLRNRVRSYFHPSNAGDRKIQRLHESLADLEFIVTSSELEALILECTLIKRYQPRYNVRLKDEKRYPFIRVGWEEDFPRVTVVRKIADDGARYFGPYTSSWAMNETLDLLRRLFPFRTCKDEDMNGGRKRACLYYHIGRCPGPCVGACTKEEYREIMERLCLFLEGKSTQVLRDLKAKMEEASANLQFERAAALRDQLQAVERVVEKQKVVSSSLKDHDVVAFARANGSACVQVFFLREGYLIGREYFVLEGTSEEEDEQILSSFLEQFYNDAAHVPSEVIVPQVPDSMLVIESYLREKRGQRVSVRVPKRGEKRELLQMAQENATATLASLRAEWEADEGRAVQALEELRQALGLSEAPARIECYDISNIQGNHAVGSMVVFVKGVARKSDYRRFRIRTVMGANDFAMMAEVLKRRFGRRGEGGQDESFGTRPDLIVVDGGKGQLNAALQALEEVGVTDVPVIGLAKEHEDIYLPGRPDPIQLARGSQGLFLLQRIRDEAHRFAVSYHRNLRGKAATRSVLEDVPGIGPKRRRALLKHFGSLDAVRQASVDELAAAPGMTRKIAEALRQSL
ncbi:MAG: excinuclease ABC subunit UvrC [Anaerolineae bacterium]|jgi:excinuclease ABC subunit C